ncbi:MAG: hypothetical protein ACD_79C01444G0002 [uncultured bacterium]|nr:MAG: hypothetical protein ACD_79C01444G0002 [uncultured bacterium]
MTKYNNGELNIEYIRYSFKNDKNKKPIINLIQELNNTENINWDKLNEKDFINIFEKFLQKPMSEFLNKISKSKKGLSKENKKLLQDAIINKLTDDNKINQLKTALLLQIFPMRKIFLYKMVVDTGIAPNPFWGYCTLAVCSPNHRNFNLNIGDWVVGIGGKDKKNKEFKKIRNKIKKDFFLIYTMKITEKIPLQSYYTNDTTNWKYKKIPRNIDCLNKKCGDNYLEFKSENENNWSWIKHPSYHKLDTVCQDTNHLLCHKDNSRTVFVSKKSNFIYLGNRCRLNNSQNEVEGMVNQRITQIENIEIINNANIQLIGWRHKYLENNEYNIIHLLNNLSLNGTRIKASGILGKPINTDKGDDNTLTYNVSTL